MASHHPRLGFALAASVAVWAAVTVPTGPLAVRASSPPAAPGCPILPADSVWHTDISSLPVHPRSEQWLASMEGHGRLLHPDFGPSGGSMPYGIPYTVVDNSHAKVFPTFTYAGESDPGPYPFGNDTPIEGGPNSTGDRHALMLERTNCTLYELYDAHYSSSGSTAGSGAVFDLRSNALRPDTWTSADAAGLPILPGLLRPDEVASGTVDHAIRVTASRTDRSYLWPARHQAGSASDPSLPPMGARFRMRGDVDISHFSAAAQVVLRAMQHYGLVVADNGSDWYFGGTAENGWDNSLLDELKTVPAGDFEAVDESSLMIDPNSAQARQPGAPIPPATTGYWMVASDGGIFSHGLAGFVGSEGGRRLNSPVVGMASTPGGGGYWLVAADGGIFSFGNTAFLGSEGGRPLNSPIVGMAVTPDGGGYWLVAADGGIFAFGDAAFLGSQGGKALNSPVVGMAATPRGDGYWLVAADGGIFSFGNAAFLGSEGGKRLNSPIVGMTATPGAGYWMVAADGGIFTFGDAAFLGSEGGRRLNSPIVGMAAPHDGGGYWLAAADGGIFTFGAAPFLGSEGGRPLVRPVVGLARL